VGDVDRARRIAASAARLYRGDLLGDEPHPLAAAPRARLLAQRQRLSALGG
jgi:hypothetical protein